VSSANSLAGQGQERLDSNVKPLLVTQAPCLLQTSRRHGVAKAPVLEDGSHDDRRGAGASGTLEGGSRSSDVPVAVVRHTRRALPVVSRNLGSSLVALKGTVGGSVDLVARMGDIDANTILTLVFLGLLGLLVLFFTWGGTKEGLRSDPRGAFLGTASHALHEAVDRLDELQDEHQREVDQAKVQQQQQQRARKMQQGPCC